MENDNEHVSPIARGLAEKIFQNCAVRLKDSVKKAIKSLNISLDNYSEVITSVYEWENRVSEDEEDSGEDEEDSGEDEEDSSEDEEDNGEDEEEDEEDNGEDEEDSSEDEEDNSDLVGSKDLQLRECVTDSFDPIRKNRKIFPQGDETDSSSTADSLNILLLVICNINVFHSNSEDISNSPSVLMLAKEIWKDFMTYPLKVFGNKDNEMTALEAVSVLIENLSLFGDEEAKVLVELQEILSSILRERENKTHLQKSSRQQRLELEECGNVVNKLRDSVGTSKMEYDDLEKQDQELEIEERELERRMQEIRAKRKIAGEKRPRKSCPRWRRKKHHRERGQHRF